MDVAREDDFIPCLTGRQNHGLDRRGCSPYHKKGIAGAKGLCRQFFCVSDDGNRMAQIIQWFHGIDIDADTLFAQ